LAFKFSTGFADLSYARAGRSMKILLVDDSRFLRIANERALGKADYTVIAAADGKEGLRLAQERKPDLVD